MNRELTPAKQMPHLIRLKSAAAAAGITPKVFVAASRTGDIPVSLQRLSGRNYVLSQQLIAWLSSSQPGNPALGSDLF